MLQYNKYTKSLTIPKCLKFDMGTVNNWRSMTSVCSSLKFMNMQFYFHAFGAHCSSLTGINWTKWGYLFFHYLLLMRWGKLLNFAAGHHAAFSPFSCMQIILLIIAQNSKSWSNLSLWLKQVRKWAKKRMYCESYKYERFVYIGVVYVFLACWFFTYT